MKRTIRPVEHDDRDHLLTYWSEKLRVPRAELRKVVVLEGSMGKAVRRYQAAQPATKDMSYSQPKVRPATTNTPIATISAMASKNPRSPMPHDTEAGRRNLGRVRLKLKEPVR